MVLVVQLRHKCTVIAQIATPYQVMALLSSVLRTIHARPRRMTSGIFTEAPTLLQCPGTGHLLHRRCFTAGNSLLRPTRTIQQHAMHVALSYTIACSYTITCFPCCRRAKAQAAAQGVCACCACSEHAGGRGGDTCAKP